MKRLSRNTVRWVVAERLWWFSFVVFLFGCAGGENSGSADAGRPTAAECVIDPQCSAGQRCAAIGSGENAFQFCYPSSRSMCSVSQCCPKGTECLGSPFGVRVGYCFTMEEAQRFCDRQPPAQIGCTSTGPVFVPCRTP